LLFTCFVFVPAYAGIRLSLERHCTDIDLLFVTAITPGAIVRGKYLAAMALTLLIFSACMPFMVLTYLLRGIDLPTIFLILATCFAVCAVANAMGLFVGAVSGGWIVRGLASIAALYFLLQMSVGLVVVVQRLLGHYSFSTYSGLSTWAGAGTFLLVVLLSIGMLYVFAVAMLSPRSANRMRVPRLYVAACWAMTGCLAIVWSGSLLTGYSMTAWASWSTTLLCVLAVFAMGERDTWNVRIRRTIPRRRLPRMLAFLTHTGSAGGGLYCTLLFAATMLVVFGWGGTIGWFGGPEGLFFVFFGRFNRFAFVLCCCLTVAALRPRCFPNVPTAYLSVSTMVLALTAWLTPYLFVFFTGQSWLLYNSLVVSASAIGTEVDQYAGRQFVWGIFLLGWLALSAMGSARWFLCQWRRFTPYDT